jgi:hypothetical protein
MALSHHENQVSVRADQLCPDSRINFAVARTNYARRQTSHRPQLYPVVEPHVSHFMQVPFRTSVKFMHFALLAAGYSLRTPA